jgi:multimeric flavodoxin WrbA
MKKVLAFNGSPRKSGNTSALLSGFLQGASLNTGSVEIIYTSELNLEYCRGCLRCNLLGRCAISGDDWEEVSAKIIDSDILVFASPVYFHHVTASMKKLIDRFRSFIHVQITETGLIHTPRHSWKKDFVVLLSMGSPNSSEGQPVIDLFEFMTSMLGADNRLHTIPATRLAVINQLIKSETELESLYKKLNIPAHLAPVDYLRNQEVIKACSTLGDRLTRIQSEK